MPESSAAKSYIDDIELPLKGKPQLKEVTLEVPQKVQKKIAKKVAACVSAGIVASTGGFIALGETGSLPEQTQEWYDSTSENIRSIFGIEIVNDEVPDKNISQTPEAPFEGLEIEGLDHVFQNGRWEYVDPDDNLIAGFWNEKEEKYEHTASVLKGEWIGLFAPKLPEDIKKLTPEGEWTKEDWENGNIRIPIPFMITKGGEIEEVEIFKQAQTFNPTKKQSILAVSRLSSDKTIVSSPGDVDNPERASISSYTEGLYGANLAKGEIGISFYYAKEEYLDDDFISIAEHAEEELEEIKLGDRLIELGEDVLSSPMLKILSPTFNLNKYQLLIMIEKESNAEGLNLSLNNLLRDDKGRFIFVIPVLE